MGNKNESKNKIKSKNIVENKIKSNKIKIKQ